MSANKLYSSNSDGNGLEQTTSITDVYHKAKLSTHSNKVDQYSMKGQLFELLCTDIL